MYAAGQAGVSALGMLVGAALGFPPLGVLSSTMYSRILAPPLAKRTQKWLDLTYEGLLKMQSNYDNLTLESLAEKPLFITTFLHAYTIALRTHHKNKLEALRNVVINTAKPVDIEDDVSLMFTNFIDTFTPWHIKILEFLDKTDFEIDDFRASGRHYSNNVRDHVLNNFPELQQDSSFTTQVIKDLQDRSLIKSDNDPDFILSEDSERLSGIPNTTLFGKRFLKIIHS